MSDPFDPFWNQPQHIEISILGTNSLRWDVAGPKAGRQGAIMAAEQVDGLLDEAPFEQEWDDTADDIGQTWAHTRFKARDMMVGFHLFEDDYAGPSGKLESDFRNSFAMHRDQWDTSFRHARAVVKTKLSGIRMMTIQMYEKSDMGFGDDRINDEYFNVKYQLRAGNPLYYGKKVVSVFTTSGSSGSGTIVVSNPTNMPMRVTWVLTRGIWTISDTSWTGKPGYRVPGGDMAGRTIVLPEVTSADGGVTITRDRQKLHAVTANGTNFLGRMQGNWVRFEIPPYTPRTELPIAVSGAPSSGARAELHQERWWSRPIGLEMPMRAP